MGTYGMETVEKAKTGVLLVGHGTRDPAGVRQFLETAALVADALPQFACQSCFLEIAEPNIDTGVQRLAQAGVERIVVMPLLLFAAGHAKQDVPQAVQESLERYPQVQWIRAAHLGLHEALIEQSVVRLREVNAPVDIKDSGTCVLMVGRGSLDDEATAEMHAYAAAVAARLGCDAANYRVAFFAMAQPKLRAVLDELAGASWRSVVVLPHLLFDGLIMQTLAEVVDNFRCGIPHIEWQLARPVGPTPLLTAAICDRILAAAQTWQKPVETPILQGSARDRQL
jgi:sirohydrochlorin cobaltochelatase